MAKIKIEVVSCNNETLAQSLYAEFDELGGNIGRAEGNALVLHDQDRYISRIHAVIIFQEKKYFIRCLGSVLPIYLNDQVLNNNQEAPIHNGDTIGIGDYLMQVHGEEASVPNDLRPEGELDSDPFAIFNNHLNDDPAVGSPLNVGRGSIPNAVFSEEIVPNQPFGVDADPLAMVIPESKDLIPADFDPFAEPSSSNADLAPVVPQKEKDIDSILNADNALLVTADQSDAQSVDPLVLMNVASEKKIEASRADDVPERHAAFHTPSTNSDNQVAPTKNPFNEDSKNFVTNQDELSRAFLTGAGVPELDVQLNPELMKLVGQLLRESTQGTLDLLLARSLTKQEVRANVTLIAPRENNPLKFSPNVEAALKHLLSSQDRGFMTPLQAMKDAHDDLRTHQFGFMAGMRAALTGIIERFDPEKLEQRFTQKNLLDSLLPMSHKAKLWGLFVAQYEDISEEAKEDFHSLFGREFLRAYEEQVVKLEQGEKKIL